MSCFKMHPEAREVRHPVGGVVDGRQPLQHHAEDDDREQPGEEGRHREPHHGHEGADLVEPRVLPVGGDDPDGDGDEDPHDVGQPHHPQRLRHPLDDEIHHRTSRRPRAHSEALARIADLHPERLLDDVERLVDEELFRPLEVAHVEGLPEPEGLADLGAHLGRDGERELPGRVVGGEIEEREYDEADRDEGRYREEQAADDVADHGSGGIGREPPPSLRLRCASARGVGR